MSNEELEGSDRGRGEIIGGVCTLEKNLEKAVALSWSVSKTAPLQSTMPGREEVLGLKRVLQYWKKRLAFPELIALFSRIISNVFKRS